MPDEKLFDTAIKQAQKQLKKERIAFLIIDSELSLRHHNFQSEFLNIDNFVQIGKILFVFEGKSKDEEKATQQLKKYQQSLRIFRQFNIEKGRFFQYNSELIRLFYYSIKQHELIEYTGSKFERNPKKWKDAKELQIFLRRVFKGERL